MRPASICFTAVLTLIFCISDAQDATAKEVYRSKSAPQTRKPATYKTAKPKRITAEQKKKLKALKRNLAKLQALQNAMQKDPYLYKRVQTSKRSGGQYARPKKSTPQASAVKKAKHRKPADAEKLMLHLKSTKWRNELTDMQKLVDDVYFCATDPDGCGDNKRCTDLHIRTGRAEAQLAEMDMVSKRYIGSVLQSHENEMEAVRNKRQEFTTAFENFDQKSNQLFNILSTVLKAMNEMRAGTVRNML